MPDAYELYDLKFIQRGSSQSAANALSVSGGVVPSGKLWTIFKAYVNCSVAETQNYWWAVLIGTGYFPVTQPSSFAIAPAVMGYFPLVREGTELKLFPGEALVGMRSAATAGSIISIDYQFVETDLPYYRHEELLKSLPSKRQARSVPFQSAARSSPIIGGSSIGTIERPTGGKRGSPEPV